MLIAFSPDDLKRYAIPIGIGLAVLLILIIPALRRSVIGSFMKGHDAGERFRGKNPDDGDSETRKM